MISQGILLAGLTACGPMVVAADSDGGAGGGTGACGQLRAFLELADLAEGFEDVPGIARAGNEAACADALRRLGIGRASAAPTPDPSKTD